LAAHLPTDFADAIDQHHLCIVWRGQLHKLLPPVFVVKDEDERGASVSRNAFRVDSCATV